MYELENIASIKNMSTEDIMIQILQDRKIEKERVNKIEKRLDVIEITSPITSKVSKRLTRLRSAAVIKWLGGKDSKAYRFVSVDEYGTRHRFSQQVFREFAEDFKEAFDLDTYSDLQKGQLEKAEKYIFEWEPCTNTKNKIKLLNNQTSLELIV